MSSSEPYWDALQEFEVEERRAGTLWNILSVVLYSVLPHNARRQLALSRPRAAFTAKTREQGLCHCFPGDCNLVRGGRICRRNIRLTRYCAFKGGFALRRDGTISTRLTDEAYRELLYYLRDIKRKELGYG